MQRRRPFAATLAVRLDRPVSGSCGIETARRGLDPNVWFGNVERVVSERVGRETVQYVSNIYKYYVAYRLVLDRDQARDRARRQVAQ